MLYIRINFRFLRRMKMRHFMILMVVLLIEHDVVWRWIEIVGNRLKIGKQVNLNIRFGLGVKNQLTRLFSKLHLHDVIEKPIIQKCG